MTVSLLEELYRIFSRSFHYIDKNNKIVVAFKVTARAKQRHDRLALDRRYNIAKAPHSHFA